ncbi:uncharacterized protein LOC125553379 [Triticum urartu]|uniref:uncharacterized protein LOC125553379 n=1 Tax=Triticum urartu TaxID=4572 RepID=UPI002043C279|nr:uncharacterized protein LOC125553379 [Triticum urartu]
MVSWSDGSSSEDSEVQIISSYDFPIKIPPTMDDPTTTIGSADDLRVMCEHGKPGKKCVAFQGISTGRRFIACAVEGVNNCGLVQWVDEEWPDHLQNALHKLWLMYEDSIQANKMACLEHSFTETYEKLVEDVNNLLDSQDNLPHETDMNVADSSMEKDVEIKKLKAVVDQLKCIHVAQANVIRNLKFNHLKEKEKMSSDKRTLEFSFADLKKEKEKLDCYIAELTKEKEKLSIEKSTLQCDVADLKKAGESNKRKLKEIKGICGEE